MKQLLLCSLALAFGLQCRASVIVSVNPSAQTVNLGSAASFDVNVSGLGAGAALGTYDLNFLFDPALLAYTGITFGSQLDLFGLGDIQSLTPGSGTVNIFELSLESVTDLNTLQANSFRLFTLTFGTLATGNNSPVTISINAVGDASGNSISPTLQSGMVTIAPSSVPEPATLLMIIVGLSGIGFAKRRHRRM